MPVLFDEIHAERTVLLPSACKPISANSGQIWGASISTGSNEDSRGERSANRGK